MSSPQISFSRLYGITHDWFDGGQFVPTDFGGVFVLIDHRYTQLYALDNSAVLGFLGEDLNFLNERPQQHLFVSRCHSIKEQGEVAQHLENGLLGQLVLLHRNELVAKLRQVLPIFYFLNRQIVN